MQNSEFTKVVEKFAEKLDTNAEQMWGVVENQVTYDFWLHVAGLGLAFLIAIGTVCLVLMLRHFQQKAEWHNKDNFGVGMFLSGFLGGALFLLIGGMNFFCLLQIWINPEYAVLEKFMRLF